MACEVSNTCALSCPVRVLSVYLEHEVASAGVIIDMLGSVVMELSAIIEANSALLPEERAHKNAQLTIARHHLLAYMDTRDSMMSPPLPIADPEALEAQCSGSTIEENTAENTLTFYCNSLALSPEQRAYAARTIIKPEQP